jgi:hypothetical protein
MSGPASRRRRGLRYYGIPGINIPHTTGFNYIEPPEEQAFMREDEYDALIADPTGFLYNVWLPRVSTEVAKIGEPATYRNNLALVKSSMAMMVYFYAFGPQIQRMRDRVRHGFRHRRHLQSALRHHRRQAARLHRPHDGHGHAAGQGAESLRGAHAASLTHVGLTSADPAKQVPIGFWMHRGCVPFINPAVQLALLAHAQAVH